MFLLLLGRRRRGFTLISIFLDLVSIVVTLRKKKGFGFNGVTVKNLMIYIKHWIKSVQILRFFWYSVSLRILSKCGKIQTRKTSVCRHFSRSQKGMVQRKKRFSQEAPSSPYIPTCHENKVMKTKSTESNNFFSSVSG